MGEEEKKEEKRKEEEKEENKKEEVPEEIVLKVDMHCGACARKVARSLRGFKGVEEVTTDCKASKVVVKGKELDPIKVGERIQKKTSRKVDILSPLPKAPEPTEPEKKQEPEPAQSPKEEKRDEPPPVITVALKMSMHCDACAQVLQRRIRKIPGVESVKTELANEQVVVTGVLEPKKLLNDVYKKTRKQASIVVKEEVKNEEEEKKKEEEKKEEKKEEAPEAKSEEDTNTEPPPKNEYWPSKLLNDMDYSHAPQMFSDENPNACCVM